MSSAVKSAATTEQARLDQLVVNTIRTLGKIKRFRGQLGKRGDEKKAMVTLAEGSKIDVTTGI